MDDRYHGSDETTFDLISRLRKEARDTAKTPDYPVPEAPKYRNLDKRPSVTKRMNRFVKRYTGANISTIAMSVAAVLLLGVFVFSISSLLTSAFGDNPSVSAPPVTYDVGYAGDYEYEHEEEYYAHDDDYTDEYHQYQYDEPEEYQYATSISPENAIEVLRPYMEDLRDYLELEFDMPVWQGILGELSVAAYYAFHHQDYYQDDWHEFVTQYARNAFLDSDWVYVNNEEDEEAEYYYEYEPEAEYYYEPHTEPTMAPTPQPTPAPPQAQQPQTVSVQLASGLVVPFVDNQTIIDLLVKDYQLRLAVSSNAFPFNNTAMNDWAGTIVTLYHENSPQAAESRLHNNIAAMERVLAVHTATYTPYQSTSYSVNLGHFTPQGADYTLPVLNFNNRAVRDWFERNFETVLHFATPHSYLTGDHFRWHVLEAHLNGLSATNAVNYMINRSVGHAHQLGWSHLTADDFR